MKTLAFHNSKFLIVLLFLVSGSCKKDPVMVLKSTYWVSESVWEENGESITSHYTLWFEDETGFMLFNGNNPMMASVSILQGSYLIEGNQLILTPNSVYSSVVPGGCYFNIDSNTLTNEPLVVTGKVHFDGKWKKAGTYTLENK